MRSIIPYATFMHFLSQSIENLPYRNRFTTNDRNHDIIKNTPIKTAAVGIFSTSLSVILAVPSVMMFNERIMILYAISPPLRKKVAR